MRVFFYFSSGMHNAHRHMISNMPNGFDVETADFLAHSIPKTSGWKKLFQQLQPILSPTYNHALIALSRPKQRVFDTDADLVHSAQSILQCNKPYVLDFEHAAVFSGYNQYAFRKPGFVNSLTRLLKDKKLKKLLSWSKAAERSLTNFIHDREVKEKTETVYPVISPPKIEKNKTEKFEFLFIGGNFYEKGAWDTLLAFERIKNKYDAHLTIVAAIPPDILARYENNRQVSLHQRVPYEKVKNFYESADAFVFPTHLDTFGYVIIEALSYGLPVISVDSFSTPELVENQKTGLLVESYFNSFAADYGYSYPTLEELYRNRLEACKSPPSDYVEKLADAMEEIINNDKLRKSCSLKAIMETTEGRFSPKIWKEKMGRIYKEAME